MEDVCGSWDLAAGEPLSVQEDDGKRGGLSHIGGEGGQVHDDTSFAFFVPDAPPNTLASMTTLSIDEELDRLCGDQRATDVHSLEGTPSSSSSLSSSSEEENCNVVTFPDFDDTFWKSAGEDCTVGASYGILSRSQRDNKLLSKVQKELLSVRTAADFLKTGDFGQKSADFCKTPADFCGKTAEFGNVHGHEPVESAKLEEVKGDGNLKEDRPSDKKEEIHAEVEQQRVQQQLKIIQHATAGGSRAPDGKEDHLLLTSPPVYWQAREEVRQEEKKREGDSGGSRHAVTATNKQGAVPQEQVGLPRLRQFPSIGKYSEEEEEEEEIPLQRWHRSKGGTHSQLDEGDDRPINGLENKQRPDSAALHEKVVERGSAMVSLTAVDETVCLVKLRQPAEMSPLPMDGKRKRSLSARLSGGTTGVATGDKQGNYLPDEMVSACASSISQQHLTPGKRSRCVVMEMTKFDNDEDCSATVLDGRKRSAALPCPSVAQLFENCEHFGQISPPIKEERATNITVDCLLKSAVNHSQILSESCKNAAATKRAISHNPKENGDDARLEVANAVVVLDGVRENADCNEEGITRCRSNNMTCERTATCASAEDSDATTYASDTDATTLVDNSATTRAESDSTTCADSHVAAFGNHDMALHAGNEGATCTDSHVSPCDNNDAVLITNSSATKHTARDAVRKSFDSTPRECAACANNNGTCGHMNPHPSATSTPSRTWCSETQKTNEHFRSKRRPALVREDRSDVAFFLTGIQIGTETQDCQQSSGKVAEVRPGSPPSSLSHQTLQQKRVIHNTAAKQPEQEGAHCFPARNDGSFDRTTPDDCGHSGRHAGARAVPSTSSLTHRTLHQKRVMHGTGGKQPEHDDADCIPMRSNNSLHSRAVDDCWQSGKDAEDGGGSPASPVTDQTLAKERDAHSTCAERPENARFDGHKFHRAHGAWNPVSNGCHLSAHFENHKVQADSMLCNDKTSAVADGEYKDKKAEKAPRWIRVDHKRHKVLRQQRIDRWLF